MWTDCRERIPIQTEWRPQGGGNSLSHPHMKNNALEACGKVPRVCVGGCSRSSTRVRTGDGYGERSGSAGSAQCGSGTGRGTGRGFRGRIRRRIPGSGFRRVSGGGGYGERSPGGGAVTGAACGLRDRARVRMPGPGGGAGWPLPAHPGCPGCPGTRLPRLPRNTATPAGGSGGSYGGAHSCEVVFGRHRRPAWGGRGARGGAGRPSSTSGPVPHVRCGCAPVRPGLRVRPWAGARARAGLGRHRQGRRDAVRAARAWPGAGPSGTRQRPGMAGPDGGGTARLGTCRVFGVRSPVSGVSPPRRRRPWARSSGSIRPPHQR